LRASNSPIEAEQEGKQTGLIIHERNDKSALMSLLHLAVKPLRPRLAAPKLKHQSADMRLPIPRKARKLAHVEGRRVEGLWVYDLSSKTPRPAGVLRRRILYFPGGSWQMPPSAHHWAFCAELVRRLDDTTVSLVSCPLAPQCPAAEAFPQIERAYVELLAQAARAGESVIVAGDSSGGNVALCLTLWTLMNRREGTVGKPPSAVVVISPATDLRHELNEIRDTDKIDPMMSLALIQSTARAWCPDPDGREGCSTGEVGGKMYRLDWSFEDPRVSPIQADLGVLACHGVRLYGILGSHDVLAPEAEVLVEECKRRGVEGEWLLWKRQMHCFPLAWRFKLRESVEAVDWLIERCEKH